MHHLKLKIDLILFELDIPLIFTSNLEQLEVELMRVPPNF